jgi:DNA modification methylase
MVLQSNALHIPLADQSVHCVITSPPYWGLRDFGCKGQLGLEKSPEEYVARMVMVFREVRRVLRADGTLWLNLGDSYTSGNRAHRRDPEAKNLAALQTFDRLQTPAGLKPKDLCGIPWRVAFALQADGWYLRSDIIWEKGNGMPESVKDRPTHCHEYLFLLTKSPRYFYDYKAIMEPAGQDTHARYARGRSKTHKYADGGPGGQSIAKSFDHMAKRERAQRLAGVHPKSAEPGRGIRANASFNHAVRDIVDFRNKRSVWHVNSKGFRGAHFATFPAKLVEPCILAGCPVKGIVFDPFFGSGTVGVEALRLARRFIGSDLSKVYCRMAIDRIRLTDVAMF